MQLLNVAVTGGSIVMAVKPRVTHRTDTRGTVNAAFSGFGYVAELASALEAGIPARMLHPSGWDGDEDDLTGFYAEQVYRLGEISFSAPDAIAQLAAVIDVMQAVCRSLSVDPRLAIPYDSAGFIRRLHESHHGTGKRPVMDQAALDAYNAVMAGWGAPSGASHDSHAHGKTPGGWVCLAEG
jgi:hypothetical protein